MKRLLIVCILCISFVDLYGQIKNQLRLEIDLANYRYDDEKNLVELYYSINRSAITFIKSDNGYHASLLMRTMIQKQGDGIEPIVKIWRVPVSIQDTTKMSDKSLVGKVHFFLEPSTYRMTLIAQDEGPHAIVDTAQINFEVSSFSHTNPSFSDIELCSSLQQIDRDTTNIFYKNTLEVVPNPNLIYGMESPVLMYYVELYNCKLDQYIIRSEIINGVGKTVLEKKKSRIITQKPGDPALPLGTIDVGTLPIHTYPTNTYTLILTLQDTLGKSITSQSKKFYLYNPSVPADTTMYAAHIDEQIYPEFMEMSEDELDKELQQSSYIAEKLEKDKWKVLKGSEAKKKFLTQFWRVRDPDQSTPVNEYRNLYHERVLFASGEYRTPYRQGWQTDRGRVYILYGKPDAIERHASESETRPYQVWTYDQIESGVVFVFIDRFGFSNFELVHSTKRGEMRDDDWQRFIRTD